MCPYATTMAVCNDTFLFALWRVFLYLLSFPACLVFVLVREFDRDLVRRWTDDV